MPSLIDLRRRIRAVKSTQQITKAMKMIAASRLRRAQELVISARPFALSTLAFMALCGFVSIIVFNTVTFPGTVAPTDQQEQS